jgi:SPP1 gp7 family putative phage head morphogenesis protein
MSDLRTLALRFQVYVERFKTGQANEFNRTLQDLLNEVEAVLAEGEVSEMSRRELEGFLRTMRGEQSATIHDSLDDLIDTMREFGLYSHEVEIDSLVVVTSIPKLKKKATANQIWKMAEERPLSSTGELLEPWLDKLTEIEIQSAEGILRRANAESWTNKQIIQTFKGTRANRYTDGLLPKMGRANETIIRTAIQHLNSMGRMKVWEDNEAYIEGYQWVSTLDNRTSDQCRSLDGQKFRMGEGPLPPIHANCRSTTVAVVDSKYDFLDKDAKRASKTGPVPINQTYYAWLKTQPAEFQDSVIGPTRGELLRNGGLDAEEFARLQLSSTFEPLTLEEMRKLVPGAFRKAGI